MATESSIVRFTNCVLACCGQAKREDLFIDTGTGKIIDESDPRVDKALVVNLNGRILSPGLLEVQLNGAKGFDFSDVPVDNMESYASSFRRTSQGILEMGVTSFLPTLVTSEAQTFKIAMPIVRPNGAQRDHELGAESLGCHCEGPFLSRERKGAHPPDLLLEPVKRIESILGFYGVDSLGAPISKENAGQQISAIRKITLSSELPGMLETIRTLTREYGIVCSLGHSPATYEEGLAAVRAGANMLTHLYNAMEPCLHRSPGLVGLIGAPETDLSTPPIERPFFGLIADGVHVAPSCARMAWAVHKNGCILTTDGTAATGFDLPDGTFEWTHGRTVVKKGEKLFLEGTDTLAGGTTTLLQCVSNLIRWTGCEAAEALQTVTATPARMLRCEDTKGTLKVGADADLVVLSWSEGEKNSRELQVDEVWKFGKRCFTRKE
ncbi:N-acetylglucosamine-6-phosphate deacetylase [Penicillium argentinense]|uniref:N-acetylglucosamine-6-phosphate deacetylase n=1 Tax=Penicillium argentinense TaxID=1131581 RepID=A0A9W9G1B1_9EURO|nr:N-acetylglucosamine-6-phosphate deacetylase [Penicillium argentinense]KAJ5110304.1 N-acetylglucosamine-6-phosphate deacetylase [Penicillium argentinense]